MPALLRFALCLFLFASPALATETPAPALSPTDNLMVDASVKMLEAVQSNLANNKTQFTAQITQAISLYTEVIDTDPAYTDALIGRALAMNMKMKGSGAPDATLAVKQLTAKLAAMPDDARTIHRRATAYRALGQFTEARADLEQAISLDPTNKNWANDLSALAQEEKNVP